MMLGHGGGSGGGRGRPGDHRRGVGDGGAQGKGQGGQVAGQRIDGDGVGHAPVGHVREVRHGQLVEVVELRTAGLSADAHQRPELVLKLGTGDALDMPLSHAELDRRAERTGGAAHLPGGERCGGARCDGRGTGRNPGRTGRQPFQQTAGDEHDAPSDHGQHRDQGKKEAAGTSIE